MVVFRVVIFGFRWVSGNGGLGLVGVERLGSRLECRVFEVGVCFVIVRVWEYSSFLGSVFLVVVVVFVGGVVRRVLGRGVLFLFV